LELDKSPISLSSEVFLQINFILVLNEKPEGRKSFQRKEILASPKDFLPFCRQNLNPHAWIEEQNNHLKILLS
jgi:hypothetical protein